MNRKEILAIPLAMLICSCATAQDGQQSEERNFRRARILVVRPNPEKRGMAGPEGELIPVTKVETPSIQPANTAESPNTVDSETQHGPLGKVDPRVRLVPAKDGWKPVEVDPAIRNAETPLPPPPMPDNGKNSANGEDPARSYVVAGHKVSRQLYNPEREPYVIRTGDTLQISIPYEPDTKRSIPVRPDGRITYLFDIEVMAAGLTYRELNALLCEKLSVYYKNPRVTIIGTEFAGNSVYVMGPVRSPGRHKINDSSRLMDILAVAGAMALIPQSEFDQSSAREVIDLESAFISRENKIINVNFQELMMKRDLSQNIRLQPNDFIYLPSSYSIDKKVYVIGQVVEPQIHRYSGEVSFMEAIASAQGIVEGAAWSRKCYVIRGGMRNPKEVITISYNAIMNGREPDIELKSGDIVYVPKNPLSKTHEVLSTILSPLRAVLELDNMGKNEFREGHRQWKDIITKSKVF
jgi:polysaccharide biosynthesis/export protein